MTTRNPAAVPPRDEPDGHWPAWRIVPAISATIAVIGCQCGAVPAKMSARHSTQHVWHQTHRRGLKLQPVEYAWPDSKHGKDGALSTGGYLRVRGHVWRNGGWERAELRPAIAGQRLTLTETSLGWEWSDGTSTRGMFGSPEECVADWRRS